MLVVFTIFPTLFPCRVRVSQLPPKTLRKCAYEEEDGEQKMINRLGNQSDLTSDPGFS